MFRYKFLSMVVLAGVLFSQSVPHAMAATLCDSAQFVSDLTIPDGTSLAPGSVFTKTWRLLNNGTCTWNTSYTVVSVSGSQMGAASAKLPVSVPPGQMLDLSVNLTAPTTSGHYQSLWKLSNTSGIQFGIGSSSTDAFWVDINVVETNAVIFDFVASAPYAQWKSGAGALPFPGASGDFRGYSAQVNNPHLEDDSYDSAAGLLTVPQNKFDGYIQATYPEFQVQAGDKLQTLVNCEFGSTSCYVTFRIDYILPNGLQKTLWSWKEAYDKRFYRANLDLSPLAGQKVRFAFMLLSSGFASGDRAIWGSPRIVRTGTVQPPAPPSTLTPLPPLTPTATPIMAPTLQPAGCDRATFVTDATVQDGTQFAPGAAFTKTWRLKNTGSCIWTTAYKLVYYSGEQMSAPTMVNLPWGATYGGTVDISVNMLAPSFAGNYRGYWILANASGRFFGIGSDASKPIWVDIKVAGEIPQENGYSFWQNACAAQWKSGAGILPCPGVEGDSKGFIIASNFSHLEDGTMGPAPSLLMSPENRYNGYIMGTFPAFTVQPGDHFFTVVGCEFESSCYVTFRLDYMTPSGYIGTFWQWREQNDKKNYTANVDLSPLAGRSVRFILTILATGAATGDKVRWGAPGIVRAGDVTPPTITPAPSTWPTYTNPQYDFQFKYPPQSQITDQSTNYLKMKLPITPGTNLVEKYLETTVVENTEVPCQSPLSATSRPGSPTETIVFNGISFLKQVGGDAAAGNQYEWVAYSTLHGNACISMGFTLHSLGAIDPTPPNFDKAAESAVFTQIMSTFGWLPATATPSPVPQGGMPGTLIASPNIRQLHMLDANNGWAIGDSIVLRTNTSGMTWYNVTAPGASGNITSNFFRNSSNAWMLTNFSEVSPGTLYRTTDGGFNWTRYDVPFRGGFIQFLDNMNGFVLSGEGSGMHKQAVQLYETSDGGATWTLEYANDPSQPNNTLPFGGLKYGMTFRDTSTGWVGGYIPVPGAVYLYKTMDSGVTWTQQALPLPPGTESADFRTVAPTFFGLNDAVLPVWVTTGVGQRGLYLYITHDGGATWSRSSGTAQFDGHYDLLSTSDAVGWSGNFYATHDSGNTWSQIIPNIDFGETIGDMDFVSTTIGWVVDMDASGNTALYRTNDGGSTWVLLFSNIPSGPLPDLTITAMHIELQNTSCLMPGDPMGVRIWITNNGQTVAGSFVVRVNNIDQTVNGLGIGETTSVFFPSYSNPVTAFIDATGMVTESNEDNNSLSQYVAVPTAPLPCVSPSELLQNAVNALNAKNFDVAKGMMGQTFGIGFWQSEGLPPLTPDEAVQQLMGYVGANSVLVPDANKDLNALLGGSDPYAIMGLEASKSLALFVSGWGLDGKGEAILYVTQRLDGKYYWHSVLIAPTGFIPAPANLIGPYAVTGVAPNDVLNIRSGAGLSDSIIGSFPADTINIMRTANSTSADSINWVEVQNPGGGTGWVDFSHLTEYVSHAAFCADTRIPVLIEQLKGSMNQSNGDAFASLVSIKSGVNVNLWVNTPPVHFSRATAAGVFTSTQSYDWGTGGGRGGPSDIGTFTQFIQPKMLEVFNAPDLATVCDDLAGVTTLTMPWPYTNIHYYNLRKPASPLPSDFRAWLIGFEYVNDQPFLHAMVTIISEP